MKNNLPEVRISYAWLLSDAASFHLNEKWGDGTPLESFEYYSKIAEKYAKWWEPEGETILKNLCEITGLEFRQNTIDVHVAPWFHAFSYPMVIGVTFEDKDTFLTVLVHEIIHRLLTDNTVYPFDFKFLKIWKQMFGKDLSLNTLVHIPVHAIMNMLFVEYLKRPELVELDKKNLKEHPDYVAAWEYVDEHGYETIVSQLRKHKDQLKLMISS